MRNNLIVILLCAALLLAGCSAQVETPETQASTPTSSTAGTEATEPTESVADSKPAVSADMRAIYDSMVSSLPEMFPMDAGLSLNMCGIQAVDCKQMVVAKCTDGLRVDEIWLIEATDEAALARLQDLARSRLSSLGTQTESYSPEQFAVVQKAELLTSGNYLALLIAPNSSDLAGIWNNALS